MPAACRTRPVRRTAPASAGRSACSGAGSGTGSGSWRVLRQAADVGDDGLDLFAIELAGVRRHGAGDVAGRDLGVRVDDRFDQEGIVCRSEEHTSELQSLMRISYAVFCLKNKKTNNKRT